MTYKVGDIVRDIDTGVIYSLDKIWRSSNKDLYVIFYTMRCLNSGRKIVLPADYVVQFTEEKVENIDDMFE